MSNSKRPKAFFLNGGMGRIISAIPALEKYYEAKEDPDFIIVIEGICNIMNGHPTLDNKTYDMYHKNLFHTKLINMDIVSPEPYRLNEYFNQKCDIAQAFDMLINNKGIRELPAPTLILSKEELLEGRKAIDEIKKKVKKEKLVILQPFGRAITQIDNSFVDKSNRSIEFSNLKQIIDVASSRGAFKPNEMTVVGTVYTKLETFLNAVAAQQKPAAGEETNA